MALVLAGGGSERMSVLTSERAVSAVPFGGKYRVVDFVLSNCCHSQVRQLGILVQHAPTSLHDHIGAGRPWDLDHREGGVLVLQPYLTRSQAGWYRGTSDAIAQNWDLIRDRSPERLLVLSGDHVYRMDYRALLETHVRAGAAATLAVTRVAPDQTRRFGMAVLDEALKGRPVDLVLDIVQPMLAAGRRVWAHRFEGYWEDVGTVGSFYRANLDAIGAQPRLELYDPAWPLLTRDEERPPVRVHEGATIEDSLVANGCRVAGEVRRSVLAPRRGRARLARGPHADREGRAHPARRPDRALGGGRDRCGRDGFHRRRARARGGDGQPRLVRGRGVRRVPS